MKRRRAKGNRSPTSKRRKGNPIKQTKPTLDSIRKCEAQGFKMSSERRKLQKEAYEASKESENEEKDKSLDTEVRKNSNVKN